MGGAMLKQRTIWFRSRLLTRDPHKLQNYPPLPHFLPGDWRKGKKSVTQKKNQRRKMAKPKQTKNGITPRLCPPSLFPSNQMHQD